MAIQSKSDNWALSAQARITSRPTSSRLMIHLSRSDLVTIWMTTSHQSTQKCSTHRVESFSSRSKTLTALGTRTRMHSTISCHIDRTWIIWILTWYQMRLMKLTSLSLAAVKIAGSAERLSIIQRDAVRRLLEAKIWTCSICQIKSRRVWCSKRWERKRESSSSMLNSLTIKPCLPFERLAHQGTLQRAWSGKVAKSSCQQRTTQMILHATWVLSRQRVQFSAHYRHREERAIHLKVC